MDSGPCGVDAVRSVARSAVALGESGGGESGESEGVGGEGEGVGGEGGDSVRPVMAPKGPGSVKSTSP